ncbi:MAG: ribosomal protein [Planctomycetota bacterium]|jgi:small subunit ribosomal protein S20
MPHSASAKKRNRQNIRNRDRNRAAKSEIKSSIRKVLDAITAGDVSLAREQFRGAAKTADQAASAGTIHRNRAARIKSRLSARVLAASKGETPGATSKGRKTAKA